MHIQSEHIMVYGVCVPMQYTAGLEMYQRQIKDSVQKFLVKEMAKSYEYFTGHLDFHNAKLNDWLSRKLAHNWTTHAV